MMTLSTSLLKCSYVATYHQVNLRAKLIDAGMQLIAEQGVRALTLREIGKRLGVSRMAAYRHFTDKADLLAAISEAGFAKFADCLEDARNRAEPSSLARVTALAEAYAGFAEEYPAYIEVMFLNGGVRTSEAGSEAGERAFGSLFRTIQEGQETGQIRTGDPLEIANMAWALIHGISLLGMGKENTGKEFVRLCARYLMEGVSQTTSGSPRI